MTVRGERRVLLPGTLLYAGYRVLSTLVFYLIILCVAIETIAIASDPVLF